MILKTRRSVLALLTVVACAAIFVAPKYAAAVDCGNRGSQDQQAHPPYSGTLPNLLSTANGDKYIYTATEWGFARAPLTNPASPGPLQLIQIGQKFVPGDNGGLIFMGCDCYQGASTMDAAEAPDGSSRMISDWVASYTNVLKGMVATTTGASSPSFGDQININQVVLGSTVAAIYHPASGRYFGYFPSNNGVQIVDLTSTNGSTQPTLALQPTANFPWAGVGVLKAGIVSIGGLPRVMLAGYIGPTQTLRVAEIGSDGTPVEKASISSGGPNALYFANVNGKAYLFSADNASGLNVYEYTGSALNFAGNLPGYFNNVIVKGSPGGNFPAIFLHRSIRSPNNPGDPQDGIDIWDSKWLATGSPVRAITIPHQGGVAPTGRGNAIEAVVTGSGSQIVAHLYRLATTSTQGTEHLLITDNIDISCIAADTTSPPTSNANFVNLSAQSRSGAESGINYYGDKVKFTDNSSTGVTILSVDWDLVTAAGTFAPNASVGTASSLTGYYPCDPAGGADFVAGGGACKTSVFPGAVPATASFVFAERSTNVNGVAQNPPGPPAGVFYSSPLAFRQPQIGILGYNATTSTLSVLSGGNADATPTQGNTAEATFQWTFNPGAVARTGMVAAVPTGASTFTLLVTWKAGYSQSVTGNINQTDLVPEFTMSPATPPGVTINGTVTLTNAMQKSPATVLNSVDYAISSGNCPASLPAFSALPSQFIGTGSIGVTAPSSAGSYCVTLRYNYTPPTGGPTSQSVSHNMTVSIQSNVTLACDHTTLAVGSTLTCTATGGSTSATFRWNWGDDFPPTFTAGSNPNSHVYSSPGGRTVTVSMTDGGSPVTANFPVSVTGGSQGGNLAATINGPASGSIGSPVGFSANATGGSGSYSYAWACDYTVLGGSSQFIAGQQTVSCTYASNGTRVVAVRVTDSANSNITATTSVGIGSGGGPGPGGLAVGVTGPATGSANASLTYTASASGGTAPYTYAWACDYNALAGSAQFVAGNATAVCSFNGNGSHVVAVRASDSASNTVVNTTATNITGPGLPSTVFTAAGATLVSGTTYTVGAGQPITFTSAEANASSWGWSFGDGTAGTGQTITKTYAAKGDFAGQLILTGNGTGTVGTNIASFTIHVVTPPPSGAFTVSGANPNAAGTVFTAASNQEVTFTVSVVSCVNDANTLCLNDNRFRATVAWAVPPQSRNGTGTGVALTGDTGYYWFFSPTNIELVLKVVDGRAFNGNYWVFYGALSNVEYTITVKDTTTGAVKTYTNPYGTTASLADVNAFPGGAAPTAKKALATSAISVVCTPTSASIGQQVSCTATPDGTYSWNWGDDFPPRYTPGPNPSVHSFSTAGTFRVTATTDNGVTTGNTTVAVTPGGSSGLTPAISGPSSGTAGTAVTFTGTGSGGTAPYSFAWNCDYNSTSPSFTDGTSTQPCTWTAAGNHVLALRVTDSATPSPAVAVATLTVTVSVPAGPGLPSSAFTLSGATLNSATGRYEAEIGSQITFTASEPNAASYGWAFGDGTIGGGNAPDARTVTHAYPQGGNVNGQLLVTGDGTHTVGLSIGSIPLSILACAGDAKTLCLNSGRFKVRVDWKSDSSSGFGTAVSVTPDTGEFWFLTANNIELVIKVVDGSTFNGHFWVFYGALSNLEYTITVTDTTTGAVKTYFNPLGTTASVADVNAF